MSIFAALDIIDSGVKVDYYYSLETPRVGNSAFANYVDLIVP